MPLLPKNLRNLRDLREKNSPFRVPAKTTNLSSLKFSHSFLSWKNSCSRGEVFLVHSLRDWCCFCFTPTRETRIRATMTMTMTMTEFENNWNKIRSLLWGLAIASDFSAFGTTQKSYWFLINLRFFIPAFPHSRVLSRFQRLEFARKNNKNGAARCRSSQKIYAICEICVRKIHLSAFPQKQQILVPLNFPIVSLVEKIPVPVAKFF